MLQKYFTYTFEGFNPQVGFYPTLKSKIVVSFVRL